jgi:hypothetical protein
MKLRASTKILFGFIGLVALAYGGGIGYTKWKLVGVDLHPIPSSDLCLLAIGPNARVKTIIANQMVQVVEASDKFGGGESSDGGGAQEGAVKKRIPVKELVEVLGGDSESAQVFVKKMRDINEDNETIEEAPIWTKGDILKAFGGDALLKTKLDRDLCVTADGKPNQTLNRLTFFYGIRLKVPITLKVPNALGSEIKTDDIVNFKPRFMTQFYKSMQNKLYGKDELQTYYTSFLRDEQPATQDLAETLNKVFKRTEGSDELKKAQRIASNSTILVNKSMIESVSMEEQSDGKVKTYDLKIRLTPDGKNRLWKFSSEGGTQILVISKGVAIAAAIIGSQLNSQELVIKQIADKRLVEEAVSLVKSNN